MWDFPSGFTQMWGWEIQIQVLVRAMSDSLKDQLMSALRIFLVNILQWLRGEVFPEAYDSATYKTLAPFPTKGHTLTLVKGEPAAVDGVPTVITVQITDPERDAATLLRAAEQLLPIHRDAPGIIITDAEGTVEGIVRRDDLEEAVLRMRNREHAALAQRLGLRANYRRGRPPSSCPGPIATGPRW